MDEEAAKRAAEGLIQGKSATEVCETLRAEGVEDPERVFVSAWRHLEREAALATDRTLLLAQMRRYASAAASQSDLKCALDYWKECAKIGGLYPPKGVRAPNMLESKELDVIEAEFAELEEAKPKAKPKAKAKAKPKAKAKTKPKKETDHGTG